ncbi:MAG: hypothetical protein FJW20_07045 [Acidimicrobiia bacterium]|nr:hypothetical protein [Acidimicrobiia bacterium]
MTARSHAGRKELPWLVVFTGLLCLYAHAQEQPVVVEPAPNAAIEPAKTGKEWSRVQLYKFAGGGKMPDGPYRPLTNRERLQLHLRNVYLSPAAAFRPAWSATVNQIQNDPPEWDGTKGFFQRMGFRFTARVVRNSIEDGGMALVGHDPRYKPCGCRNRFRRVGHAILFNFLTVDRNGKTTFNAFRYLGAYGGELAVAGMLPGGYDRWGAVRRGNTVVIWGSLHNLMREFSPEILRLSGGKR